MFLAQIGRFVGAKYLIKIYIFKIPNFTVCIHKKDICSVNCQ